MIPKGGRLLLLIPAYNEEERIEAALRRYVEAFERAIPEQYTIIVVLNGCRDQTLDVVERLQRGYPGIGVLNFSERIGKGGALIRGVKAAPEVDWIAYVDADGATAPEELLRLVALCEAKDCVIGSRWLPGAVLHRQQTLTRQFASRVFHFIVQLLFQLGVKDTQCPAKVFTKKVAEAVQSNLRIADLAFDVNLLYSMKRAGFVIHEEPTEWTDQLGSKVTQTLFRSSLVMFLSILRLRLYYSPFYRFMKPLRGIEEWIYLKLRTPFIPWGDEPDRDSPNE
ncbi:MAG: Polyprenol monophosphomannose synthase [Verrucomicrobia subdivision 3 bacterium]|nr:Polyprenol monophosphomannose synthase [Limisphaerales bacterium]MCS1415946.1 Polyprenol monophosphomannose synthase [Limisphaerales bacterium]